MHILPAFIFPFFLISCSGDVQFSSLAPPKKDVLPFVEEDMVDYVTPSAQAFLTPVELHKFGPLLSNQYVVQNARRMQRLKWDLDFYSLLGGSSNALNNNDPAEPVTPISIASKSSREESVISGAQNGESDFVLSDWNFKDPQSYLTPLEGEYGEKESVTLEWHVSEKRVRFSGIREIVPKDILVPETKEYALSTVPAVATDFPQVLGNLRSSQTFSAPKNHTLELHSLPSGSEYTEDALTEPVSQSEKIGEVPPLLHVPDFQYDLDPPYELLSPVHPVKLNPIPNLPKEKKTPPLRLAHFSDDGTVKFIPQTDQANPPGESFQVITPLPSVEEGENFVLGKKTSSHSGADARLPSQTDELSISPVEHGGQNVLVELTATPPIKELSFQSKGVQQGLRTTQWKNPKAIEPLEDHLASPGDPILAASGLKSVPDAIFLSEINTLPHDENASNTPLVISRDTKESFPVPAVDLDESLSVKMMERPSAAFFNTPSEVERLDEVSPPEEGRYVFRASSPKAIRFQVKKGHEISRSIQWNNKMDIIFIIDTSSSMLGNIIHFKDRFRGFLSGLGNLDWKIMFTNADWNGGGPYTKGSLLPLERKGVVLDQYVLTAQTEDYNNVFLDTISYHKPFEHTIRFRGKDMPLPYCELPPFCQGRKEQPLRVLKHILEHNEDYHFFRKGSHVVAIVITNYKEFQNNNQDITTSQDVMETFQHALGTDHLFSVFGIHILSDDRECLEHNNNLKLIFNEAGVALELENLTSGSGGKSFSICAPQFNHLAHQVNKASLMVSKNTADNSLLGKQH